MSSFNPFIKRPRNLTSNPRSIHVQIYLGQILLFFLLAAVAIPSAVTVVNAARQYAPAILPTKVDAFIGGDGDNKADPGETIEYTITIPNSGTDPATGVVYTDTIDANTTLVSGSLAASPVAVNDPFPVTVVGNVSINSAALASPFSVTANDFLGLNPAATISSFQATSLNGGQIVMTTSGAGLGQFTYNPPPGFEGTDSFTYTLTDNANAASPAANRTATVSITVSGMVWFINNTATTCTTLAAGCGRLSNPFSTLAAFNTLNNGSGNNPAANDNIFIYESGTAYTGGVTLLSGQRLIGQDATQSLSVITSLTPPTGSPALPAMNPGAGSATTLQNSAGNAVTLNQNDTIRGLTISSTTGAGIIGTSISNLTVGSDVSLTGVTGNDLDLSGAASGTISFGAAISNGSGRAISIQNRSGGTVSLTSAISDSGGSGVLLNSNTGATITFSGGLNLSTNANAAFTATGGGTVNVTQNNTSIVNTLTTTTGTALNVANTTIGASGLTFRSISANGATNGIVLNTTGSSGGLIVTGNSSGLCGGQVGSGPPASAATVTAPVTADCTGGTIQNTTGPGIVLISASNVSLTRIWVRNSGNDGLQGTNVTGFTLASSFFDNNGNAINENGLDFGDTSSITPDGLHGTGSIANSTVQSSYYNGVSIRNLNGAALTSFNITGSQFRANAANGDANDNVFMEAGGAANMAISVSGSFFASIEGDHFQTAALNSGTLNVNFTNNTLTGGHSTPLGQGITINAATGVAFGGYTGRIDYDINGNNITGAVSNGVSVVLGTSGAAAVFDGFVRNNVIGTSGVSLSCSTQANGVYIDARGNGTHNSSVTGNTIRQCFDRGILTEAGDGDSVLNLTVQSNLIDQQVNAGAREAIQTNFGITSMNVFGNTDTNNVCLQLGGAGALANVFSHGGGAPDDFRLRKRFEATVRLPGYAGGTGQDAGSLAQVVTFIRGQNTGSAGEPGSASASGSGGGYTGGAACNTPTAMAPNSDPFFAQKQAETNSPVSIQAASPAMNPAERFNTPLGDAGMVQLAAWVVPQVETIEAIPALLTDNSGVESVKAFTPALAPMASGETVSVTIGTLPAGKSVTIKFRVTVDNPLPLGTIRLLNQGTISGSNFGSVTTTDPAPNGDAACSGTTPQTCTPVDRPDTSVTSITRQSANPNRNPTVTWQVVLANPILNLTASNLSLVNSGLGGSPAITSVTETSGPPATTWNVTVTTGTGDGTLELRMANDTGLSHDVTNLPYTQPASGAVYTIDKTAPTVTNVTSSTADGFYNVPDVISIQVVFSEVVNVTGTPQLTLETGATDRTVNYSSGSGGNTLTFNYIAQAGDTSADLDYVSTSALALNGGTISDAATNNASLTLAAPGVAGSLGANKAIVIDTIAPTTTSFTRQTPATSPTNVDTLIFRVTFSEQVTGVGTADFAVNGGTTATVTGISAVSPGGPFDVTVSGGDLAGFNGQVGLDFSPGMVITDSAGNPVASTEPATDETYLLDNAGPTVTAVTSTAADGFYTTGALIPVTVTFSEAVTVTGTPQLTLETGATNRTVNYTSGSGTTTLTFNYTVQPGDTSADLDYVAANSLALNGGTIRDATTNNAVLTLPAPGAAGSLGANKAIVIDTTAPTVTNVSSTAANGSYGTGAVVPVTLTFSEVVTVTGAPQLTLETGAINRVVNYSSGSGTTTLTFNYTTQPGDTSPDLDYLSTAALALNGGTIKDTATNNAVLTLPAPGAAGSLGANKAIVIDATEPSVTNVSSTAANGSYGTGAVIPVTIIFSEAVVVTGTPQLTLETGATDAVVNYTSGSGTSTLTFNYTVQAGHNSPDLDYVVTTALALNGGTIQDTSGNNASLTLPVPGAAGSLGANKAIVIDTIAPDTSIIPPVPANPTSSASASFTFSGNDGAGSGIAGFECSLDSGFTACSSPRNFPGPLADGPHTFQVQTIDNAGNTDPTPASYTWVIDTTSPPAPVVITPVNGGSTNNPQPLVSGTAEVSSTVTVFLDGVAAGTTTADAAGTWTFTPPSPLSDGSHTVRARATDALGNTSVDSNTNTFIVDTVAPTVTLTSAAPDPTSTSPIPVTVTFSESVTGFTAADITPGNATVSNFTGSGSGYTFDLIPTGLGLVTANLAAGVAQDAAGNPNTAAVQFSRTFVGPEIAVLGNNLVIPDGDASPSLTDETDFGSVVLGGAITHTFTISNSGNLALTLSGSPLVALSGTGAADFGVVASPVTPVAANTSTTFQVRFNPLAAGTSVATVTIASNDSDENPYTFVIAGAGSSSSPGSTLIYLPLVFKNAAPAPDLVIDTLTASSSVTLVIRNAGNVPVVDAFWVDVYFNPTSTPTLNKRWQDIASHGQVWGIQRAALPLDPGESLTLTRNDAYYFPDLSSTLPLPVGANVFALADSVNFSTGYGTVQESSEANNLVGPILSTASAGASAAESQHEPASLEGLPVRE